MFTTYIWYAIFSMFLIMGLQISFNAYALYKIYKREKKVQDIIRRVLEEKNSEIKTNR